MSYSISDVYALNIPIFVPAIEYLFKHKITHDRRSGSRTYCGDEKNHKSINTTLSPHYPNEPNSDDFPDFEYWMQFADYFVWPHVTVFESNEDLIHKLNTLDLNEISDKMRQHNELREADLLNNWCEISKGITEIR